MKRILVALLGLAATSCTVRVTYSTEKLNALSKPLVVIASPNFTLNDNKNNNPCIIVVDGQGVYHALALSNPVNKALYDTYGVGDTIGKYRKPKLYKTARSSWLPSEYVITSK